MTQAINSTQAGYLQGISSDLMDDALDNTFHDFIQGLTNLDPKLIRPDWIQFPPNQPEISTGWISFGVTQTKDDLVPSVRTDSNSTYSIIRNQVLTLRIQFYGPQSSALHAAYRDGCNIAQNRDSLTQNGISIISLQEPRNASFQLNGQWIRKLDKFCTFRRVLSTSYPILTLTSGKVGIYLDTENGEIFQEINIVEYELNKN